MSRTPITWIDLSDLSEWRHHHTGIQRVVYNLAKYYNGRPDVKFFVFDDVGKNFVEVEFAIVERRPDDAITDVDTNQPAQSVGRRLAAAIPLRYRRKLPAFVKRYGKAGYRRARIVLHKVKAQVNDLRSQPQPVVVAGKAANLAEFQNQDTVLVLGSAWAKPSLIPALINLRNDRHFKLVQVIYDLIPILGPQFFGDALYPEFTRYMFDVVSNSDGLVAISKSSKRDVEAFAKQMRIPAVPVGTMRLGDEFTHPEDVQKPAVDVEPGKFLLCVGTFEVRKNHMLIYMAMKEAKLRGLKMPKLVIVGRPGWLTGDLGSIFRNDPEIKNEVLLLPNTNDTELAWLYQNCAFTIFPAVYEGWGLPIAESLAYGKVTLASNTSSMTEIAPGLVDHFSPFDTVACMELIHKYTTDVKARVAREKQITKDYGTHTWQSTYKEFDSFVRKLK